MTAFHDLFEDHDPGHAENIPKYLEYASEKTSCSPPRSGRPAGLAQPRLGARPRGIPLFDAEKATGVDADGNSLDLEVDGITIPGS